MELKRLTEEVLKIFNANDTSELSEKIFIEVKRNNNSIYEDFFRLVEDLSIDWMQKIFQYYEADRKEKMQDYTPQSLAKFAGLLAGDAEYVTDMCAGSGSLTIQKWNMNHDTMFEMYEYDEKVIPFLIFNAAVRNIQCTIFHEDVLQEKIFHVYRVNKGEKYGVFEEVA